MAVYCAYCNKAPANRENPHKKCAGCKNASYCSTECQTADRPIHKLICDQYAAFIESTPRPSEDHKLGILFPTEKDKPGFVWVPYEYRFHLDYSIFNCKNILDTYLTEQVHVSRSLIAHNPHLTRFKFGHTVSLYVRGNGQNDGSALNLSISKMVNNNNGYPWKGRAVAVSQIGTGEDPLHIQDITCADLRILADFFRHYGDNRIILGVKIASKFDQLTNGKPEFGEVKVPKGQALKLLHEHQLQPTSTSSHMKLPIIVEKCGKMIHPSERNRLGYNPNENRSAVYLNLVADPFDALWGFTDMMIWDTEVGNVIVFRQDLMDITPHQVEALAHFCRYKICPAMYMLEESRNDEIEEEIREARTQFVKTELCRAKFEEFFKSFREEKLATGESVWKNAVSPYIIG